MRLASVLFTVLCILPSSLSALVTSPSQFYIGSVEENITVSGADMRSSESTVVQFSGPAGTFAVEATLVDAVSLVAWVPASVLVTAGRYSVVITINDIGAAPRQVGPAFFDVIDRPSDTPPQLFLPEILYFEATSASGAEAKFTVGASNPAAVITCNHSTGSLFPLGTTRVTCTATDSFGSVTDGFLVVVGDSIGPSIHLPGDLISSTTLVTWTVTGEDNLDGPVTVDCNPVSGSIFEEGITTVHCSTHDDHFNYSSGTFQVTVLTQPPVLILPNDITAEATGPAGAIVGYLVGTDHPASVVCAPLSGSTFPLGTTTVNCTATGMGGVTSGSFHVTVVDKTPPALTLPTNLTSEATSGSGAVVAFTATAKDLVDGNVLVTCVPPSGSIFALGATTVSCHATDSRSNAADGSFVVTVVDTTPPALSLPPAITAEATSPAGALVSFAVSATDLVDGSRSVNCMPPSGATFPLGPTIVSCSSSDSRGNTATGNFPILIQDTTPPVIVSARASELNLWPPNHRMVPVTLEVIATDIADPAPVSSIISVSANQPINGPGDGNTTPDWIITGPLSLQLRAERAGGRDRIYSITVKTRDASGNSATAIVIVMVEQEAHWK